MPIYVENTRRFGGVVSMTIILGVTEGILDSKDRTLVELWLLERHQNCEITGNREIS